jgi:RHS repeat-associated protein
VRRLAAVALVSACGLSAPLALAASERREAPSPPINGAALSGATPESLGLPFPRSATPSPEEAAADAQSRTRFGSLNRDAAVNLAKQTFAVDRPSWSPPGAEQGASISKYLGPHSALEALPGGKQVVVGSSIPLRTEGSTPEPVSMTLHEVGESYAPANPLVPVAISKHVSQGLSFPAGISVAPASAEASEGPQTVGNDVVFANSAPDADFLAEPVPQGAEVSWQLRSQQSPQDDALNFNLPSGASLRSSAALQGGVEVIDEGQTLMMIPPALALQADGRSLPTSYAISGHTLTTHVDLSGTVDFPVMLDPILVGTYGVANGANVWSNWHHADNCGGCFEALEFYNLIQTGANPPPPENDYGEWYIYAPGAGNPGGAGIARVDLSGVIHERENQSDIQAGIQNSTGGSPVYSFNGYVGASGPSPLNTWAAYSNQPMAFCAQGAGGHDGGEQPLCDENYAGQDFYIADILGSGRTVFNYIRVGGATITYLDTTPPNFVSWPSYEEAGELGETSAWVQYGPTKDFISASDQGLGIQRFELQLPPGHSPTFKEEINCNQPNGFVGCPGSTQSQNINLSSLATGVYEVGAVAVDAAGNATLKTPYPKLYVDHTPPSTPTLSGPLAEAANTTIGNGNYTLKFSSEDGSSASPQSGVRSFEVKVDGRAVYSKGTTCPAPTGIPASNCFGLSGEWTMNGQSVGAGQHVVSVTAKDWTGNSSTQTLKVTVQEGGSEPVGPGAVNLETGDYKLTATDVSIGAANATLSLSRTYDSRSLSQGANGPLGPQWVLSLPDSASSAWQSLTLLEGGRISVYTAGGQQLIFTPNGSGGWTSPAEYQTDYLSEPSAGVYQITDANGNYTKFTQPGSETHYVPSTVAQASGAGGLNKVVYTFAKTAGGIIEPTKVIASEPSEGACTSSLVRGCRELTFNYATSKTASGEAESEWGDYEGRLTRVYFTAWEPAQSKMSEPIAVAQYAYDTQGRLRAEWDPRVTPSPLKTIYGYDEAGHVTALTPPGQQTFAFHYGTIAADANEGRLLSVTRPSASGALWNGQLLKNTTAPALSGSAKVGVKMTVIQGSWSATAVSYGYQWMDCNSSGGACAPILGATNPSYTLASGDVGHTLVAHVSATNGGGTITAPTAHSAVVETGSGSEGAPPPAPEARSTIEYRLPTSGTGLPTLTASAATTWAQSDDPTEATAIFPPDEPQSWPASDYKRATLYYLDARSRTVNVAAPTGGISTTEYDEHDNVVRTLSADNRASALAEGAESKTTAEKDDTKSTYSADGTELETVLGPTHDIKFGTGETALYVARTRTHYSYDEGAPAGGPYRLVTKRTEGVPWAGEERDVRTTTTSYSGQEGLGWELHAPTLSTADPSGLDLVHKTVYDRSTGNVQEDISPGGNSETIYPFAFSAAFGSEGTGNGQFKKPAGSATDAAGNVWVVDEGNSRIEKFSSAGAFIAAYGSKGTGNGQFQAPWGIAINQSTGNVYVADKGNNRIEELSSSGAFVATFGTSGSGALSEPTADALDSSGDVWVSDWGHNRLVEFSAEGSFIREAGSNGTGNGKISGPGGLVVSEGSVFVADYYNSRIDQFSTSGASLGQFGSKGSGAGQFKEPYAVTANPSTGALYVADTSNNRIQELSPAGRFLAQWQTWGPSHQLSDPTGLAVGAAGKLYVSDPSGNQVSSWTPPEAGAAHLSYASQLGSSGSGNGQFSTPINTAIDGEGNLWVTDCGNNRIEKFSAKGSFIAAYGKEGSGNGQYHCPGGIDINQSTGNVYVADTYGARIEELSSSGAFIRSFGTEGSGKVTKPGSIKLDSAGNVWAPDMSADKVFEFSSSGAYIAAYGKEGSGEVQFKQPTAVAFSGENVYIADSGNHRVQELSNKGAFIRQWGKEGGGGGELYDPEGIAADAAGNLYVVDAGASHVEEFTASGGYIATFATKGSGDGQVKAPIGDAIDAAGDMYVVDTEDNRVEKWTNANVAVHDTKTIYYSNAPNGEYKECGEHAEWAGLPCRAMPAQQPYARGLPGLPETTYTYNIWDEPTVTTDTVGTTTRTTTITYDGAGRVLTRAISSSIDAPVPMATDKYSETTGALIEQSANAKAIKNKYNTLGQLERYTDADGNESSYTYDVDGRPETVNDGKGTQTYGYDGTTGLLTSLKDSALKESASGGFTASYDVEGRMVSEGYPNGMSANYSYDQTGQPTHLEYIKTTHCSSGCNWYRDVAWPSGHGQLIQQNTSLGKDEYVYDHAGRLTEVQETPTGKGCTTRLYALDEEANRTGLTTRSPGAEGECATEGGTTEHHLYDEADRLVDGGVTYDVFGNTTALPSADAGGNALTSSYYVNDTLASQSQSGETISYGLDPADRTRETVSTGTSNSTIVSHFSGSGDSPAWSVDSGGKSTRYIKGIDGSLAAIQVNGGTPVLQLPNLHGDIVATAAMSETETKLLSSAETTEFGVSTAVSPLKYSWLGAEQRSTESPTVEIAMGARSYIPQLGRFEQTDPQPGGSASPYGYTSGDPVNSSDPSGEFTSTVTYDYEAASTGAAQPGLSEHYVVAGAIMPPPVNLQIEQEFNASPPWDAAAALDEAAEPEEGEEEGADTGGTPRRFRNLEDPIRGTGYQSECNRTGQSCSGHRGGQRGGRGGGHAKPQKSCPKGYYKIPWVEICIKFEWPSGPSPAPSYPPPPEGPVPVAP